MEIARTWAGVRFLVAIAMFATFGLRGHEADAGDIADPMPWDEAVAAVGDLTTGVSGRRLAAATLESLALDEDFDAEARTTAQDRALRDDLAALAAIVGRSGDDLRIRMTLVRVLETERLKPMAAEAVPALLGVIGDEADDPALRQAIIAGLAPVGPVEPCRDAVLAAARSRAAEVRATALYTLERMTIDPELCLTVAETALDDPTGSVRLAALDLVGDLAEKRVGRAVNVLLHAFHHQDRALRLLALVRLRALGPDASAAVGDLIAALKDPDPRIRIRLATVLADLTGDAGAYVPYLIDGLKSKDIHVWRSAASDLMFGWRRGSAPDARVPALTAELADPDPDVQGRASIVLAHVTHRADPYARGIQCALESSDPATRSWAALWGKTVLRDPLRVAHAPTPPPSPARTGRLPSPLAIGVGLSVGLLAALGLGVVAWFDARARR
jgi:hypothetical protein